MKIVHLTFEKITGLPGTFEGIFYCEGKLNTELPLIFNSFIVSHNELVFTQDGRYIFLRPVDPMDTLNYLEHFYYGVNFLIKEISGGNAKVHSQNLN